VINAPLDQSRNQLGSMDTFSGERCRLALCSRYAEGSVMQLDPDEETLLESFEGGEWKSTDVDEIARMRELARNQPRVDVQAGVGGRVRGEARGTTGSPGGGSLRRSRLKAEPPERSRTE